MHCPAFRHDPAGLQQRYIQELILVAERGGPDLHQLFLDRYREQLGCLPSWLPAFGPTGMADVFRGATEARRGKLPPSVLSYRLALPKWFSLRLQDPWAAWRLHQTYIPGEIAVDPTGGPLSHSHWLDEGLVSVARAFST